MDYLDGDSGMFQQIQNDPGFGGYAQERQQKGGNNRKGRGRGNGSAGGNFDEGGGFAPDLGFTMQGLGGFPPAGSSMAPMGMPMGMPSAMGMPSPPPEWANTTTVMMRNLPNKYTQRMLLTEINQTGFLGSFDFLYLPIDPETNANRGYSFLNFIDPSFAWMFKVQYENRKMNRFNSSKVVNVMPATLQGFEANYAHYASARVNRGDPASRPLFLREPKQSSHNVSAGPSSMGGQNEYGKRGNIRRRGGNGMDQQGQQPSEMGAYSGGDDIGTLAPSPYPQSAEMEMPPPQPMPGKGGGGGSGEGSAPSMVPKFCPHCGGSINANFQFCPACGASQDFSAMMGDTR